MGLLLPVHLPQDVVVGTAKKTGQMQIGGSIRQLLLNKRLQIRVGRWRRRFAGDPFPNPGGQLWVVGFHKDPPF